MIRIGMLNILPQIFFVVSIKLFIPVSEDVSFDLGGLFGGSFVGKHILPLLQTFVHSCIYSSNPSKFEPMQSWSSLALTVCLTTIDGLVPFLTNDQIVKELIDVRTTCRSVLLFVTDN